MADGKRPDWNGSAVTPEMLLESFPITQAWRDAVRNAWLLAGGREDLVVGLYGPDYAARPAEPMGGGTDGLADQARGRRT